MESAGGGGDSPLLLLFSPTSANGELQCGAIQISALVTPHRPGKPSLGAFREAGVSVDHDLVDAGQVKVLGEGEGFAVNVFATSHPHDAVGSEPSGHLPAPLDGLCQQRPAARAGNNGRVGGGGKTVPHRETRCWAPGTEAHASASVKDAPLLRVITIVCATPGSTQPSSS